MARPASDAGAGGGRGRRPAGSAWIGRVSAAGAACAAAVTSAAPHDAGGAWFRGNTHVHTVLCGHADSTPEAVAKWYLDRGYHFLVLSEHNQFIDPNDVELPADRREDFILIPGQEITGHKVIHTTALNTRGVVPWDFNHIDKSRIVRNHVEGAREAGGEAILNHPNFQFALTADDMRPVRELRFFELFNGHPSVHNEGSETRASTEAIWDDLLTDGRLLYGVSSDDAHQFKSWSADVSNPGRGWVVVESEALEPDAITEAMKRGDFYSSSGVHLRAGSRDTDARRCYLAVDEAATLRELEWEGIRGRRAKEGDAAPAEGWRLSFIGPEGRVLESVAATEAVFTLPEGVAYGRAVASFTRRHPDRGLESFFAWLQPVFGDGREEARATTGGR